jgi:hypothetical protein
MKNESELLLECHWANIERVVTECECVCVCKRVLLLQLKLVNPGSRAERAAWRIESECFLVGMNCKTFIYMQHQARQHMQGCTV